MRIENLHLFVVSCAYVLASQADPCLLATDCGLSLSWEPTEEAVGCHEFSPNSIKDRLADPEKDSPHRLVGDEEDS